MLLQKRVLETFFDELLTKVLNIDFKSVIVNKLPIMFFRDVILVIRER